MFTKVDYSDHLDSIYTNLSTNPKDGLTKQNAEKRLLEDGPNEIPKSTSWLDQLKIIISPLLNWLILIYLIGAAIMYWVSSLEADADLSMVKTTLGIVFINCFIAIFQQIRATKKLNALRELSAPESIVIRDGKEQKIHAKNLVKGDLIKLSLGDKIPADCRIVQTADLQLNEASLTGESEPVRKNDGSAIIGAEIPIAERKNMVFLGTFITSGTGKAIVVETGSTTELGKIQEGLKAAGAPEIPIRKKMNHFGKFLGLTIAAFWVLIMFFMWVTTGKADMYKSLNSAMDMMPINIPLLTTIILITGVLAMAKEGVIVRNLSSVDSFGRVSVVCSDKTGTLTKSQMTVLNVFTNGQIFKVSGLGYKPEGDITITNEDESLMGAPVDADDYPSLKLLLESGYFNNNAKIAEEDKDIGESIVTIWSALGNPTEASLQTLYLKQFKKYPENFEIIQEYPFSSKLKRMSKIVKYNGETMLYTKGATSVLLDHSSKIFIHGEEFDFTAEFRKYIMDMMDVFAGRGFRVLSLAYKPLKSIPDKVMDMREEMENGLVYLGFVTILDPAREMVSESITKCHNAGVDVVMITGDSPLTAKAIANQIKVIRAEWELAISGQQIASYLNQPEFDDIKVFARVSPEDKETIIKKYRSQNKVVAMTGDGVNDALALNLADVGIAMGISGTDVAKEASDMVISDDSFKSIVTGLHQGRGIFQKIRTIVFFFIAINVFEGIVQFFLAVILNKPYFLGNIFNWQWIWLSITLHMFPGLIITFDTISDDVMKEKPKNSEEILAKHTFQLLITFGVLLAVSMLVVYFLVITETYGLNDTNLLRDGSGDPEKFLYSDAYTFEEYFYVLDPENRGAYLLDELGNPVIDENKLESFKELAVGMGYDWDTMTSLDKLHVLRVMGKTLTMLMTVLFFTEAFLVLQIRRPNKSLLKSIIEDSNFLMYFVNFLLFASYLGIMYGPGAQPFLARLGDYQGLPFGTKGYNLFFMHLSQMDWLICFAIALITIIGVEVHKKIARKKYITL